MMSAQEEWRDPGTVTWLERAEVGRVRDKGPLATHTHTHSSKKKIEK